MTDLKSNLKSLQNLHDTLWIQSGDEHAKTLKKFNDHVSKTNQLLRKETMPDGTPLWNRDLNGYELLSLNEYISA